MYISELFLFAKMVMYRAICILVLQIFVARLCLAQIPLSDVNVESIQSSKVTKYVQSFENEDCRYFSDLEASVDDNFERDSYSYCEDSYSIEAPVEKIWETCLKTNPAQLWKGKRISLSFIYNQIKDKLMYCMDLDNYKLETNQIYFINLRVLRGMYHLPTALKITNIDEVNKTIIFTYLKGGKSEGRQELSFIEDEKGNSTKIVHKTHFKSNSKMRDRRIYPFFHHKIVRELHRNIEKEAKTSPK